MLQSIMVYSNIRLTADFLKDSGKAPCFAPAAVMLEYAINPLGRFHYRLPVRAIHGTASINMRLSAVSP